MTTNVIPIPFRGDRVVLIERDGEPYVPARPICENLGIDWKSQHRKLTSGDRDWGCGHMTIPSAGGEQETLCLPLRSVMAWLFTVSPSRVKPELKDKLVAYQAECADALWRYWSEGEARRPGLKARAALSAEQNRVLRMHLLAAKPAWNKVLRYLESGCNWWVIRALCHSMRDEQFNQMWEAMADCGLVPRSPHDTVREETADAR